jgi:hypothetical protein
MKNIITEAKKMITAKALISAASLGLLLPFIKLVYWVFDTSYLSGFGISPDIYSRPIFSSGFVSVWLFINALVPMVIGWALFSAVVFVVLFNINFGAARHSAPVEQGIDTSQSNGRYTRFISSFSYAYSKSVSWPLAMFLIGAVFILFITKVFIYSSEKGASLAEKQLKGFSAKGECRDTFDSNNTGCFHISTLNGTDHFVIANHQTYILYLSRNEADEKDSNNKIITRLHVHEKEPGKQYSITRDYKPTEN